jgi:hypothetical protein
MKREIHLLESVKSCSSPGSDTAWATELTIPSLWYIIILGNRRVREIRETSYTFRRLSYALFTVISKVVPCIFR